MEKHENLSQQENNVVSELQDESTPSMVTTNRIRRAIGWFFLILVLAVGASVVYRTLYPTDSPLSSTEVQEEAISFNKDETTVSGVEPTPEVLLGDMVLENESTRSEEETYITSGVREDRGPKDDVAREDDPS